MAARGHPQWRRWSRLLGHASVTTTVLVYGHSASPTPAGRWNGRAASLAHGGAVRLRRGTGPGGLSHAAPALLEQTAGRGPARVPSRGPHVRRRGPGAGPGGSLPGSRAPPAGRPQQRHVPGPSPALGREERPNLAVFAATTDFRRPRQRPNTGCRVTGCGYGTARGGMCRAARERLGPRRATRPARAAGFDPPTWKTPPPGVVCAGEHCECGRRWCCPLCHAHVNTWKVNGRPEIEVFVRRFEQVATTEEEIIRLDLLALQLRLEIQYVLQCRHDQRPTKTLPAAIGVGAGAGRDRRGVAARPDRGRPGARTGIGRPAPRRLAPARIVTPMPPARCRKWEHGWEGEFDRDVWQMRRLGFTRQPAARLHRARAAGAARPGE